MVQQTAAVGCWCFFTAPTTNKLKPWKTSDLGGRVSEWGWRLCLNGKFCTQPEDSTFQPRLEQQLQPCLCSYFLWTGIPGYARLLENYFVFIMSFYSESTALWRNSKPDVTITVSSEGNWTPVQLFTLDSHLLHLHNPELPTAEVAVPSPWISQSFPIKRQRFAVQIYYSLNAFTTLWISLATVGPYLVPEWEGNALST